MWYMYASMWASAAKECTDPFLKPVLVGHSSAAKLSADALMVITKDSLNLVAVSRKVP